MKLAQHHKVILFSSLASYALALLCIYFSRQPGNIATLWYANAVGVLALQSVATTMWPLALAGIGIAQLAANATFGDPFLLSLSFIPGNVFETFLGAYLLKRFGNVSQSLSEPTLLIKTLALVGVAPPMVGAVIGAATLAAYGLAPFTSVWPNWAIGSVTGTITVFPLGLLLLSKDRDALRARLRLSRSLPLAIMVALTAVIAPQFFALHLVFLSAALLASAFIGRIGAVAIAMPLATTALGGMVALGVITPPPGVFDSLALNFYLSVLMALLPPLFVAVALERIDNVSAEVALSEKKYRDIYNLSPAMMHSLSPSGVIESVSDAWLDKMGYTRDEVLGKSTLEFLSESSRTYARDTVLPALHRDGQVKDIDYQMIRKNGTVVDVRFSALWQLDGEGHRLHKLAVISDVTEEKRLERSLQEEKSRLASILDGTDVGTWEWNLTTGETRFNDRWYAMLGYAGNDPALAGMTGWEPLVHPDDVARCVGAIQMHLSGQIERCSQELRLRHRDGHWVHVLARGKLGSMEANGGPGWLYGTHLDISDIKVAQQAAEEGKYFLERIAQISGVGAWSVDLASGAIDWSDQTCRIHDLPPKHRPTMEEAVGYYLPESRERVEAAIGHAIDKKEGWDLELQMQTATGRPIWVRAVGEVELGPTGHPTRLVGAFQDITARRNSEAELRRLNVLISNVLQAASEMSIIATDLTGRIQVFNAGAQRMLGYYAEELVGLHPITKLHLEKELQTRALELSEEHHRPVAPLEALAFQAARGQPEIREWTYVSKNGQPIPVSVTSTAMFDTRGALTGYLCIGLDISQRLADQRALAEAAKRMQLAVEMAEMGVWTWEVAPNTLHWNSQMYAIYGYPESIGEAGLNYEHWRSRIHPEDLASTEASLQGAVAGTGVYDPVFRILTADGNLRYVHAAAHVERDAKGAATRVIGINLDRTDQVLLEGTLRHAKEMADQANQYKSSFLANMSHEIRTPMNAVLGMLQLVKRTKLDLKQQDYLDKTEIAAKSLLGLLNDILDFSKIEAGKMELDAHPFDLERLLRDLAVVLSGNAGDRGLEILFDMDARLPHMLIGDKLRLQQVLVNLAGNAIKFTASGEVVLRIWQLERHGDKLNIQFSVQDSGIGIAPEQIDKIFEGFSQAEASTTRRFGGTGLGLSICKKLVTLMGGDLTVTSELGKGSCFTFAIALPIAGLYASETKALQSPPWRVLVVDDNAAAREIETHYCRDMGWTTDVAANGRDAIAMVMAAVSSGQPYDAVLLDWRMPDMSGLEVAKHIQSDIPGTTHPIVLMVSAFGRESIVDTHAAGTPPFAGYLQKPFTPAQLQEALRNAFAGNPIETLQSEVQPYVPQLTGLNVLVVEDNHINRQIAKELLTAEGANVALAESGLPGVELACDPANHYDVVLMDVQMPDIDGMEATRRIRKRLSGRSLPIIAMTANVSAADQEACRQAGMDDHVGKPVDVLELVTTIQHVLGLKTRTSPQRPAITSDDRFDAGVQVDAALRRFNGNQKLFGRTLDSLKTDGNKMIESALTASSQKELAMHLHTLKGITATVGASRVSKYAGELEHRTKPANATTHCIDEDDAATLRKLLAQDQTDLLAAFALVEIKTDAHSHPPEDRLTYPAIAARLHSVLPLLQQSRMEALEVFQDLLDECSDAKQQELAILSQQIQQLQFAEAERTLRALIQQWEPVSS